MGPVGRRRAEVTSEEHVGANRTGTLHVADDELSMDVAVLREWNIHAPNEMTY